MFESSKPSQFYSLFFLLHQIQDLKRSVFAALFCLPTSLLALLLLFLLAYNGFTVFWIHIPFRAKPPPKPAIFSPGISAGDLLHKWSSSPLKLSYHVLDATKEENPPPILKTHFPLLLKSHFPVLPTKNFSIHRFRRAKRHKRGLRSVRLEPQVIPFPTRLKSFFAGNSSSSSSSSCKVRFFMTWISSLNSFGERELLAMESLFKSHPNACLVIVSKSLDSDRGTQILLPFLNNGFRVMTIAPDFDYIFKDTHGEAWFNSLREGKVNTDADVIVLKSFSKLRNTIGAQSFDVKTGNWSRLNNAVLIFDKNHPLLFKFIQEFALTFDGNKWGHNGPYLVSRVVSRVTGRPGFNFTVLPPSAFYLVDWSRIRSLFQGPRDELQIKWLFKKLGNISKHSFAVHLWNRQSRKLVVEKGSIVDNILSTCCIFCNTSFSRL
ncbi:putative Alpha 1,4-glycosyltransferase family protein [Quillaja saponaria]|uniref:Alpha 1,4-glycosyltransferase family protein n=1 Tax=Quillaja saponaria TaxID=32244 RepID=A0AAD7KW90_QUISA|nr:putative Alpha 1,4-glycosyltransferase family protein [Quillaja saponaria]